MKALILAAGFGSRLAPHTDHLPKALFPIGGIPVLGRMIAALKKAGFSKIAVNAHHLADQIRDYLSRNDFGLPVLLSLEEEILGTGGAIRQLADFWDEEPFLVVNADILTDIDIGEVYRAHCDQHAPVTLVMHACDPFNQVWVDAKNRVVGFQRYGLPTSPDGTRKMAFTGIHVIDPAVVEMIPAGRFYDIIAAYRLLLDQGAEIRAHIVQGHAWQDMGTPERYRDAVLKNLATIAFQTAFGKAPAAEIQYRQLAGDGSDRNWYRLEAAANRLILADHGITPVYEGSEIGAFVEIGNHLRACGLPVPRIYDYDAFSGLVFLEDLGDVHLQRVVRQANSFERIESLYRAAIDTLLDFTAKAADGFDPRWTCQSRAYDRELILEKECRYFVEALLTGYLKMDVAIEHLWPEFEELARRLLDNGVPGLIHRDFQSRNIMVREKKQYLIDFQGMRHGPVQYDLASLLIDPYVNLDAALRQKLLEYAAQQAELLLDSDPERFIQGYEYCRVARNLQMLGAFGYLSRVQGKSDFERWIPDASFMLADHIKSIGNRNFPKLAAIAQTISGKSQQEN
jgi:NDP-sugar pyrophosphorylase family protein/tRNA A-37 threonylcarbamoyl transferase component Bud32